MCGLREFGDDKADVILKFYDDEAKELKELGEIPEHVKINEGDYDFEDDGFGGGEEDKEEDDLDIDIVSCFDELSNIVPIDLKAQKLHKLSLYIHGKVGGYMHL